MAREGIIFASVSVVFVNLQGKKSLVEKEKAQTNTTDLLLVSLPWTECADAQIIGLVPLRLEDRIARVHES